MILAACDSVYKRKRGGFRSWLKQELWHWNINYLSMRFVIVCYSFFFIYIKTERMFTKPVMWGIYRDIVVLFCGSI